MVLDLSLPGVEERVPGSRCSVLRLDPGLATLHHGVAPSLPTEYWVGIDGMPISRRVAG